MTKTHKDVFRIEIERASNGWKAKVWRHGEPHLVELIAHTYGEISDLVFTVVAEIENVTE